MLDIYVVWVFYGEQTEAKYMYRMYTERQYMSHTTHNKDKVPTPKPAFNNKLF